MTDDQMTLEARPPGDVTITEMESWRRGLSTFVLGFCSLASGILTYQGLRLATKPSIAALLAAVSVVLAYACWKYLTQYFARSAPQTREALALKVGLPTVVLVTLTSTITGFAGLAAPAAMQHSLVEQVDRAEAMLLAAERRMQDEAALLPILEAQAVEWAEMAEDESARGRFYKRGKGSIYGGINGIARAFAGGHKTLEDSDRRRGASAKRAATAVASMRLTIDEAARTDEGMREASRAIAGELRLFNVALAELDQSPLPSVLVGLETAREQQVSATLTAKKPADRAAEKAAKDAVSAMVDDALANVRDALGQTEQPRQVAEPLRVPLPLEALGTQLHLVAPMAGYVVAIDLFLPLFVLMALAHLHAHLRRQAPAELPRKESVNETQQPDKPQPAARLAVIAEGLRRHRSDPGRGNTEPH